VVPLAGQYFVYFHRICRYFFVAREVQTREVLLVVCDDLERLAPSMLPLDGAALLFPLFIA
jgi:hypothetical protein